MLPQLLEGSGLTSGAVEGQRELCCESLAKRLGANEPLELRHQFGARAGGEINSYPLLKHVESSILEPRRLSSCEWLEEDVR